MKYQKKVTIVEANQAGVAANFGVLGNLVTDDFILILASGAMHTLSSADMAAKYTAAAVTSSLTGEDWN